MINYNLVKYIDELTHFAVEKWGCPRNGWQGIQIVEDSSILYDVRGENGRVQRTALFSPEDYEARFEELMGRGYSWLNMNARGIVEGELIIIIELPTYTTPIKGRTSVNFSGPFLVNNKSKWDASERIIIQG